jgi:hypothetical protein
MWLVDFLPKWFFFATFVLSLAVLSASFILSILPFFKQYVLPARLVATVVLVGSTWLLGGHANEDKWLQRVAELEAKIKESEEKSKEVNTEIVTKVVTKTKVIKEKAKERIAYIDREVVKYDTKFLPGGECEIPKEFFSVINQAAEPVK